MTRIVAILVACLLAGCASRSNIGTPGEVVRSKAPVNYESTISNYFDLTVRGPQTNRELIVGNPERGTCPLGRGNGMVGWVVPVQYNNRNKDGSTIAITKYYFWFSEETLKGVTRRMEVCP